MLSVKQCKKCLEFKDVSEFSKHPSTKDRLQRVCKECDRELKRTWYQVNIKREQEKRKNWQMRNRKKHNKHAKDYFKRKKMGGR